MHRTGATVHFDRRPSGRFTGKIFLEQGFHLTNSDREMNKNSDITGIVQGPLRRFSASSAELIRSLLSDADLSDEDRLCLENHLLKLHLAYAEWKRRKSASDSGIHRAFW